MTVDEVHRDMAYRIVYVENMIKIVNAPIV